MGLRGAHTWGRNNEGAGLASRVGKMYDTDIGPFWNFAGGNKYRTSKRIRMTIRYLVANFRERYTLPHFSGPNDSLDLAGSLTVVGFGY